MRDRGADAIKVNEWHEPITGSDRRARSVGRREELESFPRFEVVQRRVARRHVVAVDDALRASRQRSTVAAHAVALLCVFVCKHAQNNNITKHERKA